MVCAIAGDDSAYGELVRRRQGAIRQLFRRLCRDPALADDLAQQTFLQAWRTIRTVKSPAAFGGWLKRLAVNVWLQRVRAERSWQNPADLETLAEQGEQPSLAERFDLDSAHSPLRSSVKEPSAPSIGSRRMRRLRISRSPHRRPVCWPRSSPDASHAARFIERRQSAHASRGAPHRFQYSSAFCSQAELGPSSAWYCCTFGAFRKRALSTIRASWLTCELAVE